jgi:arylformamidase
MYREYTQKELDAQYNMRARHPEFQDHFDLWERESERVRATLHCMLDIAYGDSPGQTLDIFPAQTLGAPMIVFIHGGYWQGLDKKSFSYVAEPLVAAGAAVAVINYDLAPQIGMDEIVRQVRQSLVWVFRNAASFNGEGARLHVSGHSAGGHLTAMMMAVDWEAERDLPTDVIKGGCSISGLFDLEPIRLCYLNEVLGMDSEVALRNSPTHLSPGRGAPLIAAVGGEETNEFLRQNSEFAAAWKAKGCSVRKMELPGLNHFTIVEELANSESPLTQAILNQMSL